MPESNSDLWGDIFRLALAWGVNRSQGSGSGDTPNFYNVPLTPEQKRVEDEKWRVYQAGGSDTQKTVQGLAKQFLSGQQGAPPSFSFLSPEMKGQTFAGGLRAPTFDFSKLPTPTGTTTPTPTIPPPGPGTSPIRTNPSGTPAGAIHTKIPIETGFNGDIGRTPVEDTWQGGGGPTMDPLEMGRDNPNLWFNGGGMNWSEGAPGFEAAANWWSKFKQEHPNWAEIGPKVIEAGLAAAFGLPGALAGRLLRRFITRDTANSGTPPPPPTGGNASGFIPIGGAPGNTVRP